MVYTSFCCLHVANGKTGTQDLGCVPCPFVLHRADVDDFLAVIKIFGFPKDSTKVLYGDVRSPSGFVQCDLDLIEREAHI